MSSFSGFTDADIRKVQNGDTITTSKHKKTTLTQKPQKLKEARQHELENKINLIITEDVPATALLNVAKVDKPGDNPTQNHISSTNDVDIKNAVNTTAVLQNTNNAEVNIQLSINDDNEKKAIDLEKFQIKQKLMEEQNRFRKELVAKALADRTKRTQEEQQKLSNIQVEFKRLDAHLSNDVKILRQQIENASYDYMEAQKRYNKIEKEFLDAKLLLHQKLEKKEMLTEHLCAIIEKNEERKAIKLNELLQKLAVLDLDANIQADTLVNNNAGAITDNVQHVQDDCINSNNI